ncbi:Resistin [Acipenser ruthenus]|uniref:Resistin n=1 Tax=Acipenser ruthenus TaxID=7906 RepID=A0A444UTE3_ACIRT|nr:Resistin [Acipenser ruthenus]
MVFRKQYSDSEEEMFALLRDDTCLPPANRPQPIRPPGLDCKRKQYLYEKIQEYSSAVLGKVTLSCIDVPGSGFEVECPKGYKPTGCSCTNAGCYWDISNDKTCICQCSSVTMNRIGVIAHCCKIAM